MKRHLLGHEFARQRVKIDPSQYPEKSVSDYLSVNDNGNRIIRANEDQGILSSIEYNRKHPLFGDNRQHEAETLEEEPLQNKQTTEIVRACGIWMLTMARPVNYTSATSTFGVRSFDRALMRKI